MRVSMKTEAGNKKKLPLWNGKKRSESNRVETNRNLKNETVINTTKNQHARNTSNLSIFFAVMPFLGLRLLDNPVEKLAPCAELRHKMDESFIFVHVVELDNARVVNAPQDVNLTPQALDPADLALFDCLDCETLGGLF